MVPYFLFAHWIFFKKSWFQPHRRLARVSGDSLEQETLTVWYSTLWVSYLFNPTVFSHIRINADRISAYQRIRRIQSCFSRNRLQIRRKYLNVVGEYAERNVLGNICVAPPSTPTDINLILYFGKLSIKKIKNRKWYRLDRKSKKVCHATV